jgi:hypothetical protein
VKALGFIGTGSQIIKRETPLGLYKGLGAVLTGIIPKMAIRFTSYEKYKQLLADANGKVSGPATFVGKCFCFGLGTCNRVSQTQFGLQIGLKPTAVWSRGQFEATNIERRSWKRDADIRLL